MGFVPVGALCSIEGCNSCAILNGRIGNLVEACPDGRTHALVHFGGEGVTELLIHRKNLRLVDPAAVENGEALPNSADTSAPEGKMRHAEEPVAEDPAVTTAV